jgi:metal-responsive CopG/Arc/MetJ family transcriptional regulator
LWNILWNILNIVVVQIVIDKKLLQAADLAARRVGSNRSAVVRDALREHLRRLEIRDQEERDRRGYSKIPQSREETLAWEMEAAWPPK